MAFSKFDLENERSNYVKSQDYIVGPTSYHFHSISIEWHMLEIDAILKFDMGKDQGHGWGESLMKASPYQYPFC